MPISERLAASPCNSSDGAGGGYLKIRVARAAMAGDTINSGACALR
jgi:hypothetical protein